MLSRVHFSQLETPKKKRDILSEKRESGMALKSVSLRLKAVILTHMQHYGKFSYATNVSSKLHGASMHRSLVQSSIFIEVIESFSNSRGAYTPSQIYNNFLSVLFLHHPRSTSSIDNYSGLRST